MLPCEDPESHTSKPIARTGNSGQWGTFRDGTSQKCRLQRGLCLTPGMAPRLLRGGQRQNAVAVIPAPGCAATHPDREIDHHHPGLLRRVPPWRLFTWTYAALIEPRKVSTLPRRVSD